MDADFRMSGVSNQEFLSPPETAFLKDRPSIAKARGIILTHGWNSTSYQILNPGISRWFSKDAVVGFVTSRGVRVAAGAPVCALDGNGRAADLPQPPKTLHVGQMHCTAAMFYRKNRSKKCSAVRRPVKAEITV